MLRRRNVGVFERLAWRADPASGVLCRAGKGECKSFIGKKFRVSFCFFM
ncbi:MULTISPECIES: hypothetical protein [Zoogloea]|jgi:hypothetical protein|nr:MULTISPECIES: hypothetical protein [Zoogloea]MBT9499578.1 hypothetical protein [Zoogloea sp.]MDY0037406.1 hypothetical protein [Zoogloea oleivorans]